MPKKVNKIFTASIPEKGVVLWDTTLRPLCDQLKDYDSKALGYVSLHLKMKDTDRFEFFTKSGNHFIIQRLTR